MAGERRTGFRFLSFFRCCSKLPPLELERAGPEASDEAAETGPTPETEGQLHDVSSSNHEPSTVEADGAVPETEGPLNDTSVAEQQPEAASAAASRGRSTWKGKGKGGYQDGYGASRSRAASLDRGRGRGQCHYGFHCTRVDCWFQHPVGRAIDGWRRAASVDRGKARGKGHCFDGFECTRSICRFEHPTGRRRDLMPATSDQRGESSRHRSSRDREEVVARMDLNPDYCKQLKDGMLYHLSFFLRRYQLLGRISEQQLELFSRSAWISRDLTTLQEEIQVELARLSSLRVELTEQLLVPETLLARFMGPGGINLQFLRRTLGVEILVESEQPGASFLRLCGAPDVLETARSALENHLISFSSTQLPFAEVEQAILRERSQTVHVFVDNSNICIGCQLLPNGFRDFQQRISIRGFTSMVQGVRKLSRRVVMGSRPSSQRFWAAWKREGYEVCTAHRDPRNREEFVDGRLVGEALMHVLQPENSGSSQVLVLATGDGNLEGQAPNTAGANFQNLVRTIARRDGWTVEVWCWRSSCHSCYKRMARNGQIRLYFLDGLRKEVTMTAGSKAAPSPSATAGSVVSNEGLEEHQDTCVQCLMAEATHAFNPCNHRILCRECAMETRPHWNTCPLGLCFLCRCPWDDITASDQTIAI
eukprot:s806_g9.t1